MAWIMDTISMHEGAATPQVVTGKPVELGGSIGRDEATSRGLMYIAAEAAKTKGMPVKGASVAIQGFGNVGGNAARLMASELGANIIAVSDSHGGIYNKDGLELSKVERFKAETGSVTNFPGAKNIGNDELLELECDFLVPAALENVINEQNVDRILAKIVVEGANGPTTPKADEALLQKKIMVVPDILSNAGGCDRLLLRMGPGPAVLLDSGRGQRKAPPGDDQCVRQGELARPPEGSGHAHRRGHDRHGRCRQGDPAQGNIP